MELVLCTSYIIKCWNSKQKLLTKSWKQLRAKYTLKDTMFKNSKAFLLYCVELCTYIIPFVQTQRDPMVYLSNMHLIWSLFSIQVLIVSQITVQNDHISQSRMMLFPASPVVWAAGGNTASATIPRCTSNCVMCWGFILLTSWRMYVLL